MSSTGVLNFAVVEEFTDRPVRVAVDEKQLSESDRKELVFWSTDRGEGPDADLFENVIYKSRVMIVFRLLLNRLKVKANDRVLELGAGHGWASVMAKAQFPSAHFTATDLSHNAIGNALKYETLIGASVDEKWACSAIDLPFEDNKFDLVFCFAAFHHFIIGSRYSSVLEQVHRVLKPGGRLVMLYEPSAPRFIYNLAKRRTENKRHFAQVDEDVILLTELKRDANSLGFDMKFDYYPEHEQRIGVISSVYYYILSKVSSLTKFMPCTVNVELTKR